MTRVHIIGAGIGGLTAAHELSSDPDLEIHVWEKSDKVGGKAASQSMDVNGDSIDSLGEHGFRFFPWFYRHLPHTLRQIPTAPARTVQTDIREARAGGVALEKKLLEMRREPGPLDALRAVKLVFGDIGATIEDMVKYSYKLGRFWTACDARKMEVFENQTWSSYVGLDDPGYYSPRFERILKAIPIGLVAMRADEGSARTIGNVSIQLMTNLDDETNDVSDGILSSPTTHGWMRPWHHHLTSQNVKFHFGHTLETLTLNGQDDRIIEIKFSDGTTESVENDQVVCAIPIEGMKPIVDQLKHADASLDELGRLIDSELPPVGNMVGLQFALPEDIPLIHGHVTFSHSDWAITAVSQRQFWTEVQPSLAEYFGVEGLRGVISAIVSDWDTPVSDPDSPVHGKKARDCTEDEVIYEVWRQMRKDLPEGALPDASQADPWIAVQVDQNVSFIPFSNESPLLVHPPGSYLRRPESRVAGISNLQLASDYVRTNTDLATMESANEAGRRAAASVLDRIGSGQSAPEIFEFPLGFDTLRAVDCLLYHAGRPHVYDASSAEDLSLPAPLDGLVKSSEDPQFEGLGYREDVSESILENARNALPLLDSVRKSWSEDDFLRWQEALLDDVEPSSE